MIENISSIYEIIAAIYITLAFDNVIDHFVEKFDVRKKLIDAINNNTYNTDEKKEDINNFVNEMSKNYIKRYSKLSTLMIFLSLTFLYVISFKGLENGGLGLNIVVFTTEILGLLSILYFMNAKTVSHKCVIRTIMAIFTIIVAGSLILRYFFCDIWRSQIHLVYHYLLSFCSVLILFIPIVFLIYRSYRHPKLCAECLAAKMKLIALLKPEVNLNDDNEIAENHSLGFLSQKTISLQDVIDLLKDKDLASLKKEIKKLSTDYSDIVRGDETRQRHLNQ